MEEDAVEADGVVGDPEVNVMGGELDVELTTEEAALMVIVVRAVTA